jgi:hypothetical protein
LAPRLGRVCGTAQHEPWGHWGHWVTRHPCDGQRGVQSPAAFQDTWPTPSEGHREGDGRWQIRLPVPGSHTRMSPTREPQNWGPHQTCSSIDISMQPPGSAQSRGSRRTQRARTGDKRWPLAGPRAMLSVVVANRMTTGSHRHRSLVSGDSVCHNQPLTCGQQGGPVPSWVHKDTSRATN